MQDRSDLTFESFLWSAIIGVPFVALGLLAWMLLLVVLF